MIPLTSLDTLTGDLDEIQRIAPSRTLQFDRLQVLHGKAAEDGRDGADAARQNDCQPYWRACWYLHNTVNRLDRRHLRN
jgi:hypothetical protein